MGVAAFATALASFAGETPVKKEDESKKKKYHIIHQQDGVMYEYDTIIPMNSKYSVEDFLTDKGIDSEGVKIIEIPNASNMALLSEGNAETRVFMHQLDEEVILEDEGGTHKEVKIIREENADGEVIMKKYVNGKEVEVTDEDIQHIEIKRGNSDKDMNVFIEEGGNNFVWEEKHSEKNVELKVEVDDEGKMTVRKFVNGEEVEVSEEELQKIESGNGKVMIIHEENAGNIDIDSILHDLEFDIEVLEEMDTEEGQKRIIVKEVLMENLTKEGESEEIRKEIRVQSHVEVEGDEDFTVVLVTENYDASAQAEMNVNVQRQSISGADEAKLNQPISVFPNPNNGTFTIAFEQKNKLKTAIRIVDGQGKVVFKEKLGNFSGSYRKEVDLKKQGPGMYIVTVQQGDETSTRKVIVE